MIRPVGAKTFREALRMGAEVFHAFKRGIEKRGLSTAVETKVVCPCTGWHRRCF